MEKEKNFNLVHNYLIIVELEDGKVESDVLPFKKEMVEKEFKALFEQESKMSNVKAVEVVYLGTAKYFKDKVVVYCKGKLTAFGKKEKTEVNDGEVEKSV